MTYSQFIKTKSHFCFISIKKKKKNNFDCFVFVSGKLKIKENNIYTRTLRHHDSPCDYFFYPCSN